MSELCNYSVINTFDGWVICVNNRKTAIMVDFLIS